MQGASQEQGGAPGSQGFMAASRRTGWKTELGWSEWYLEKQRCASRWVSGAQPLPLAAVLWSACL